MHGAELGAQSDAAAPATELREALGVKNTFIDVNRQGSVEGGSDIYKRQVSEPAPSMLRQLSGQGQSMWRAGHAELSPLGGGCGAAAKVLEESELFDDEDGGLGGGQGLGFDADDPGSWLMGCRGFGRQETEQVWPSWPGFAADLPEVASHMGLQPPDLPQPPDAATLVAAVAAATAAAASAPAPFDAPAFLPSGESSGAAMSPGAWETKAPYSAPTAVSAAAAASAGEMLPTAPPSAPLLAAPPLPADWANTTTVMMRNLPNKYTQAMLIEELSSAGFEGAFDFLYLPIDPETHANRGYAFLNLLEPGLAWMMKQAFEGRKMSCFNSDKVVTVAPAALQGFEANYAHYSTSRVNRGDPSARPLFLRNLGGGAAAGQSSGGGGGGRGVRRRGGRRGTGSLIDIAIRQQTKTPGQAQAPYASAWPDQAPQFQQRAPPPQRQPQQVPRYAAQAPRAAPWDPDDVSDLYHAQRVGGAALGAQLQQGIPALKGVAGQQDYGADTPLAAKFCPYCGGRASGYFNFCSFCGSSLSLTSPPS